MWQFCEQAWHMGRIISYLTFNGNCREAMTFYHQCLGGDLHFQTLGEAPHSQKLPVHIKNLVLQARLTVGELELMATDLVSDEGLNRGNGIALYMLCDSNKHLKHCYRHLEKGGKAMYPVMKQHKGWFGGLRDQFGNYWLLYAH